MYLVIALLGACALVVLSLLAVYLVRTHGMQSGGSAYIVLTSLGGRFYMLDPRTDIETLKANPDALPRGHVCHSNNTPESFEI